MWLKNTKTSCHIQLTPATLRSSFVKSSSVSLFDLIGFGVLFNCSKAPSLRMSNASVNSYTNLKLNTCTHFIYVIHPCIHWSTYPEVKQILSLPGKYWWLSRGLKVLCRVLDISPSALKKNKKIQSFFSINCNTTTIMWSTILLIKKQSIV